MFNPIKASQNIKKEFIDYITTSHAFADQNLQKSLIEELNKSISKGPILEIKETFTSGKTINELIKEGIASELFTEIEKLKSNDKLYKKKIPLDRPLYMHQERAFRKVISGDNLIVSTGTGSGKTECFLLPIINDLLREIEQGTLNSGVRALLIYPMNALANDQIKRIREIFMKFPQITFGVYNGATEEDEKKAIDIYEAMFSQESVPELRHKLDNELLSRTEMKETPPHILFTNYAMLEHMLLRPKDDRLFAKADFKFIVLDEAHVYQGAMGIETALLMRRLRARISSSRETQFILTSATLGNETDSPDDVVKFARNLCGVNFFTTDIIWASREKFVACSKPIDYPQGMFEELANSEEVAMDIIKKYGYMANDKMGEKEMIYDIVSSSKIYNLMRELIVENIDFTTFSNRLNLSINDALALITLCSKAVKNGKSLVEARFHFFIKSLEGCYVCLSPNKQIYLSRNKQIFVEGKMYRCFEVAVCDDCGKMSLVGKIEDKRLEQVNLINGQVDYFTFANDEMISVDEDSSEDDSNSDKKGELYYLCPYCGAIIEEKGIHHPPCECGVEGYIKIRNLKKKTGNSARCQLCGKGKNKRFFLGNEAATSVLATSLYEELPEHVLDDDNVESSSSSNPFIVVAAKNKKQHKKSARQFLVFSDSRQEAAKFACYLTESYKEFLRRRGIWQIIKHDKKNPSNSPKNISEFVKTLSNYYSSYRSFSESNSDKSNLKNISDENAWIGILNELHNYRRRTSLVSLGQIKFEYLGNSHDIITSTCSQYGINNFEYVKEMLNILAMEIVKSGAISTDAPSDISDVDREYIYFCSYQKSLNKTEKKYDNTCWMPRHRAKEGYYRTNKMELIKLVLKVDEDSAFQFLENYWGYLIDDSNDYKMVSLNKDGNYAMPAKNFVVRVSGDEGIHWYKCEKCGRISPYTVTGKCSTVGCGGNAREVFSEDIEKDNHYAKMYAEMKMSPLFIKEHTAQLSKHESAVYQQQFIKKEINALSCSTTFEMGVDVGDLETVFLRNMPPLPANYAQRAGRAGRSIDSVAFALTFAKLSSHDFTFFKEPNKMISGTIMPPIFKLENEKIVKRHIFAIALSMFFGLNPEMYNHNNADKFINQKGYESFENWLLDKPEELKNMIISSIPNEANFQEVMGVNDFSWVNSLFGEEGSFSLLINEYWDTILEFENQIKKLSSQDLEENSIRNNLMWGLERFKKNQLIDFLARGNILPKYGFPVDTVELSQTTTAKNIKKLRLTRDLQIAISEYAPSSQVIADGKLYTSRYIKKSKKRTSKSNWDTAYICECTNQDCKATNYSVVPAESDGKQCSFCNTILKPRSWKKSIEPRSGFATDRKADPVPMTKQDKVYRTQDYYLGDTTSKKIEEYTVNLNGIDIKLQSTTNDSLLVKSLSSFYVCEKCGFAIADDEYSMVEDASAKVMRNGTPLKVIGKLHESQFGQYTCDNKELMPYSLHHKFSTDVAKISFGCDTSNYETMISASFAILFALSQELNIERRDVKVCLSKYIDDNNVAVNSIIIYDSVPGGAGHSRRLVTEDGAMLTRILKVALRNTADCPQKCDPSCYACLRSYENQRIHDLLDRNKAHEFLSKILNK